MSFESVDGYGLFIHQINASHFKTKKNIQNEYVRPSEGLKDIANQEQTGANRGEVISRDKKTNKQSGTNPT